jgi:N-acetylmuramoyl-L-alanine amidase
VNTPARILLLAAIAVIVVLPPAPGETPRTGRNQLSARGYVRLNTWAQANDFYVRWLDRDRTLELSNGLARLVFTVDPHQDSRKARINGTEVWLALPLVSQNGSVCLSQIDIAETLEPLLSPPSNPPGMTIQCICLDPGHGGKDPGFQVGSQDEKKYTLLLAKELRDQLKRAGLKVVLTRTTDTFVERAARTEAARKQGADLFVSLHFNSAGGQHPEVKGLEVYCLTPEGAFSTNAGGEGDKRGCTGNRNNEKNMLLAYQLQKSVVRSLSIEDRGVHRARFEVLRDAAMPAILIEGGYMSNPGEGGKIFDPAYRRQMARAIVEGILAYKRTVNG